MNNGNAAKKIDNVAADDSWSGMREVDGKVAERDAALGQGNQIEAVADAQKQATISSVGETPIITMHRVRLRRPVFTSMP